jgi:hypothetical protein
LLCSLVVRLTRLSAEKYRMRGIWTRFFHKISLYNYKLCWINITRIASFIMEYYWKYIDYIIKLTTLSLDCVMCQEVIQKHYCLQYKLQKYCKGSHRHHLGCFVSNLHYLSKWYAPKHGVVRLLVTTNIITIYQIGLLQADHRCDFVGFFLPINWFGICNFILSILISCFGLHKKIAQVPVDHKPFL